MKDTEIEITHLIASPCFDPWNCFNSIANIGTNARELTWQASQRCAPALILTEGQKEAFRDLVRSSGGWSREECAEFSDADLTALCIQWIAADIREGFGDDLPDDPAEWDWADYNEQAHGPSTFYLYEGKLFWSCEQ